MFYILLGDIHIVFIMTAIITNNEWKRVIFRHGPYDFLKRGKGGKTTTMLW